MPVRVDRQETLKMVVEGKRRRKQEYKVVDFANKVCVVLLEKLDFKEKEKKGKKDKVKADLPILRRLVEAKRRKQKSKDVRMMDWGPVLVRRGNNRLETGRGRMKTKPQGMMHGDGPPILPSWPAFNSPYPHQASGLKPQTSSSLIASVPPKPHSAKPSHGFEGHIPNWYNTPFGKPLGQDSIYSQNHHGVNGYLPAKHSDFDSLFKPSDTGSQQIPHQTLPEFKQHAAKAGIQNFMPHGKGTSEIVATEKHLANIHEKVNGYPPHNRLAESVVQTPRETPSSMPPPSYEESIYNAKKSLNQPRAALEPKHNDSERFPEMAQWPGKTSYGTQSGHQLADHMAFSNTTSANPLPVTSSADRHMISYYGQMGQPGNTRSHHVDGNDIRTDEARKVAAAIMGEAQFSMKRNAAQEQSQTIQPSPFTNISNMYGKDPYRQHTSPFEPKDQNAGQRQDLQGHTSRPHSNQSSHSLDFQQNNDRPENVGFQSKNQSVFNGNFSGASDFWSQFGLPPPNVVASSQLSNSRLTNENVQHPSQHSSVPNEKYNQMNEYETKQGPVYGKSDGNVKNTDKKKTEKPKRRTTTGDPATDEQVDAKVQQILAALREKAQSGQPKQFVDKQPTHIEEGRCNTNSAGDNDSIVGGGMPVNTPQVRTNQWIPTMPYSKQPARQEANDNVPQNLQPNKDFQSRVEALKPVGNQVNRPVYDSQHLPYQAPPPVASTNGYSCNIPMNLAQQVHQVRGQKKDGRISPCCDNCEKLGEKFSPHCQSHKNRAKQMDPYAFIDESDNMKEPSKFRSVGKKHMIMANPYQVPNEYESSSVPSKPAELNQLQPPVLASNDLLSHKSEHRPDFTQQIHRSQTANTSKKVGSKTFTKYNAPSLMYYKKSLKYQQSKALPAKKHQPNGKLPPKGKRMTKKSQDEEFSRNLLKNLGFPPLTPADLISKRQEKLPSTYLNGHSLQESNLLNSTNKNEPQLEPTSSYLGMKTEANSSLLQPHGMQNAQAMRVKHEAGVVKIEKHATDDIKCPYRSRSAEGNRFCFNEFRQPLKRSRSFDDMCRISSNSFDNKMDVKVVVDDKVSDSSSLQNGSMASVSSHIQGLQQMVTGENNLATNTVVEVPKCGCLGPDYTFNESCEGPYYTHLGAGRSVEAIRKILEQRTGVFGKAIRIEKVRYSGKEGKSSKGCPIAKWIIRRSNIEEKYLAVVRHRQGHFCQTAWLIIGMVAWEGVPQQQADDLYDYLSGKIPESGFETERRCGTNEQKMCACQGADLLRRGASFSFGCSWSMYFNGCKFARSKHVRKFRLKDSSKEEALEDKLQDLATHVGPLYKQCAPEAHDNQAFYSEKAQDCRLGKEKGGPFSGVTACVDFCAHAHRDIHNMNNGSTVVVTLTKHRGLSKPDDEQLHVLPMYVMEPTDEHDSFDGQYDKIQNGAIEVLHHYPLEARIRSHPLVSCKKRRQMNAKSPGRKKRGSSNANGRQSPWGSSSSAQSTPKKGKWDPDHSHDSNQSFSSQGGTPLKKNMANMNMYMNGHNGHERPITYEELMALSSESGFEGLYNKFWNYFYMYGAFPPTSFVKGYFRTEPAINGRSNVSDVHMGEKSAHKSQDSNVAKQELGAPHHNSGHTNNRANEVPFEQLKMAAKPCEQTPEIPHAMKDTIHLTHPFSDCPSARIPQSNADHMFPQPSSNNMSGNPVTQHTDAKQSANSKSDSYSIPQSNAMDLSSHPSGNISRDSNNEQRYQTTSASQSVNTQEKLFNKNQPAISAGMSNNQGNTTQHAATATAAKTSIQSPLDLLSMTVEKMRTKDIGFKHSLSSIADHSISGQDVNALGNFMAQNQLCFNPMDPLNNNVNENNMQQVDETSSVIKPTTESMPSYTASDQSRFNTSLQGHFHMSDSQRNTNGAGISQQVPSVNCNSEAVSQKPVCTSSQGYSNVCQSQLSTGAQSQHSGISQDQARLKFQSHLSASSHGHSVTNSQGQFNTGSQGQSSTSSPGQCSTTSQGQLSTGFHSQFSTGSENQFNTGSKDQFNTGSEDRCNTDPQGQFNTGSRGQFSTGSEGQVTTGFQGQSSTSSQGQFRTSSQGQFSTGSQGQFSTGSQGQLSTDFQGQCSTSLSTGSKDQFNIVSQGQNNTGPCTGSKDQFSTDSQGQCNTGPCTGSRDQFNTGSQGQCISGLGNGSKNQFNIGSQGHCNTDRSTGSKDQFNTGPQSQCITGPNTGSQGIPSSNFQGYFDNSGHGQSQQHFENQFYTARLAPQQNDSHGPPGNQPFPKSVNSVSNSNTVSKNNHKQNGQHINSQGMDFTQAPQVNNGQLYKVNQGFIQNGQHSASYFDSNAQFQQSANDFFMRQESESCPDPDVVKCQMEYNEDAFRDPEIGGVAIALSHGAVLFEVAKRELHATTGLKKPNRYHPTRISLVFYQHKNLNNERHGMYAYAKKLENMKRERMERMQAERGFIDMMAIENSFKGGKKRKMMEDAKPLEAEEYNIMKTSAAQYRYMWDCNTNRQEVFTTNTVSQKWITPQPMVTGPYQKWV